MGSQFSARSRPRHRPFHARHWTVFSAPGAFAWGRVAGKDQPARLSLKTNQLSWLVRKNYIFAHTCPNCDCGKVAERDGTPRRYSVTAGRVSSYFRVQATWARQRQREHLGSRRRHVEGWGTTRAVLRCLRAWRLRR